MFSHFASPSLLSPPLSTLLSQSSLNYLEFACQLVEGLPVAAILSAILKLTQYTMSLPLEKPPLAARKRGRVIFDPASHSTKQLLHFQYTIYHLMGGAVGGAGLAQKVSVGWAYTAYRRIVSVCMCSCALLAAV